jgi:PIN domain nuclease of toxin-antitoxin system
MRLLLDTHIALWALVGDPRLPERAAKLIANPNTAVFVSAASVWEISIKHALARGLPTDMPISGPDALRYFQASGYELLSITADHAAAVQDLPPLHRDPFDRMLVAQAQSEELSLISCDPSLRDYDVEVLW